MRRAPMLYPISVTGRSPWAPLIRMCARRMPAFCALLSATAHAWSIICTDQTLSHVLQAGAIPIWVLL